MIGVFAAESPGFHDESIYWSAKDILGLERHGARTLRGLRVWIAVRFLVLAAAESESGVGCSFDGPSTHASDLDPTPAW